MNIFIPRLSEKEGVLNSSFRPSEMLVCTFSAKIRSTISENLVRQSELVRSFSSKFWSFKHMCKSQKKTASVGSSSLNLLALIWISMVSMPYWSHRLLPPNIKKDIYWTGVTIITTNYMLYVYLLNFCLFYLIDELLWNLKCR